MEHKTNNYDETSNMHNHDTHNDFHSDEQLLECIYEQEQIIKQLEIENSQLKNQLRDKQIWLDQLQDTILATSEKRRTRQSKTVSGLKTDLMNYYNERKNDEELLQKVKNDLCTVGYNLSKIPWQMIKHHTDKEFIEKQMLKS